MKKQDLIDAVTHGEDPDEEQHLYVLAMSPSFYRAGPVDTRELDDDEAADLMTQLAQGALVQVWRPAHSHDCDCGKGES